MGRGIRCGYFVSMNVSSIAEVKVLTSGYQAE
jgi:hypothetical protein